MNMHNPPHPGEFIESIYMEPHGISCRTLATHLGVAASTLNRVVKGKSAVSPESWLSMQDNYELWQAKQNINLDNVQPIDLHAA